MSAKVAARLSELSAVLNRQLPALDRLIVQRHITPITVPESPESP